MSIAAWERPAHLLFFFCRTLAADRSVPNGIGVLRLQLSCMQPIRCIVGGSSLTPDGLERNEAERRRETRVPL